MSKKLFFLAMFLVVLICIVFFRYFEDEDNDISGEMISYYVETGEDTGVYEKQKGNTWPSGYVLNEEKSICDNGSTLSWDSSTNSVKSNIYGMENCDIYFDLPRRYLEIGTVLETTSCPFSSSVNSPSCTYQSVNNFSNYSSYGAIYYSLLSKDSFLEVKEVYVIISSVPGWWLDEKTSGYLLLDDHLAANSEGVNDSFYYSYKIKISDDYDDLCINGISKKIVDCNMPYWWHFALN